MDISELEKRISKIEERNRKVELNKAWELSLTRRIVIAILTYLIITIFFYSIGDPYPFINSIVPTTGFIISNLSLSLFRSMWEKYFKNKNHICQN